MKIRQINSQLNNLKTYQMYMRQMLGLAENVFEFTNLPEFIDLSYLNKVLLRQGSIAFIKDEELGVIALPYTVLGKRDVYDRPISILVDGENGYHAKYTNPKDFVIMYDNNTRYPIFLDISQIAQRIALCVRTTDINISQQRTPRIWKTNENKKKSLQDILNQIDSLQDAVASYDSIDIEDIEGVLAPAPFVTEGIDRHLDKLWAEFFRLIGVANLTEQKKERVIRDEMSASLGGTIASRFSRFEPRKRAVEEINRKFGLNMSVRYYDGEPNMNIGDETDVSNDDISTNDA